MALNSAVCGLIFKLAVWRNKNARHHRKAAACRSNHVAHNVAVIVFASPENAAFVLHYARNNIVDERIEVGESVFLKICLEFRIENLLENFLETAVISLADCVFCRKPDINFLVKRISETASCKAFYRFVEVMDSLNDARAFHLHDCLACFVAVFVCKDKLGFSGAVNVHLAVLVNVAVGMSAHNERLFPAFNGRFYVFYDNRLSENCAVKLRPDYSVRAWCKLLELIFFHAGCIRCNCCAFNAYAEALYCSGSFVCDFIV